MFRELLALGGLVVAYATQYLCCCCGRRAGPAEPHAGPPLPVPAAAATLPSVEVHRGYIDPEFAGPEAARAADTEFYAMANNCDAAPPDPWMERRMKDWILERHNAWAILGIPPQSSMEMVVKAFRRLSIRHHPDKNRHRTPKQQEEAATAYLRISQARNVLTHPTMRDLHDDLLSARWCLVRRHTTGGPVDDSDEPTESFNWEDWHRGNQAISFHSGDPWNDAMPVRSTSHDSSSWSNWGHYRPGSPSYASGSGPWSARAGFGSSLRVLPSIWCIPRGISLGRNVPGHLEVTEVGAIVGSTREGRYDHCPRQTILTQRGKLIAQGGDQPPWLLTLSCSLRKCLSTKILCQTGTSLAELYVMSNNQYPCNAFGKPNRPLLKGYWEAPLERTPNPITLYDPSIVRIYSHVCGPRSPQRVTRKP